MTEYPKDIVEAACRAAYEYGNEMTLLDSVAAAIFAERLRGDERVLTERQACEDNARAREMAWQFSDSPRAPYYALEACKIADSIAARSRRLGDAT